MTAAPQPPDETDVLFYVLRRKRAQAWTALLFERVWPALWPPLGIAGLFLCFALLGGPALLPIWGHIAVLVVFAVAIPAALIHGLLRLTAPSLPDTDRRLERASGLRHRPLQVLHDTPALPGADDLWRAHIARARAQITRLRVGLPRPGLAALDRRALRIAVAVALVASLGVAGEQTLPRLARAVQPHFAPPAVPPDTLLQAWITPPGYTGLAPVFLKKAGGAVTVPAGSHLTVSVSGGDGVPELVRDGVAEKFQMLGAGSFQADQDLDAGGRLAVRRGGRDIGAWDLSVVANRAPVVSFPEPPGMAPNQRMPQIRLPWRVAHDYGVVGLGAELRLDDRADLPPLVIAIPLPGGAPKSAKGARLHDLTAHPWAGLPVTAQLTAKDATGLVGTSAQERFRLPERRFEHPVARALMATRKNLTLKPTERARAVEDLERLARLDDVWKDDFSGFLNLRAIGSLLRRDRLPSAIDDAQRRMWELALHLEEGAAERSARALEQARQALREVLEAEKRGEQVDKADIDRRMQEVQEALQKHLDALAEQARRDPGSEKFDPDRQRMDARDLQRLAEQMRDAAREDRMEEARDKLAEMEKLLEELEKGRPERGKMTERQKQRAEKRQKGEQQMSAVQDMVRRQGGLLDQSQQRADGERGINDPRRFLRPQPSPTPPDATKDRTAEQRIQQALRRALGELMQQHGDLTGEVPPNLGEADMAMRDAGQALAQGRDADAAAAAQKAIEALQKGGRAMSQQMARMFGRPGEEEGDEGDDGDEGEQDGQGRGMGENGQDGNQPGNGNQQGGNQPGNRFGQGRADRPWGGRRGVDRRADERRDPLGRQLKEGSGGLDESGLTQVPEEMELARTRAIQDELRRRGADRTRPQPELDYIDRLLRQF